MAQLQLSQDDQGWVQIGLQTFPSATSRNGAKGQLMLGSPKDEQQVRQGAETRETTAESASGNPLPQ